MTTPWLLALACVHQPPEAPMNDPLGPPPVVGAAPSYTPPVPETFELSNGIDVWLITRPGIELVSLQLVVAGGAAEDPAGRPGLVSLTDTMLLHGAGERDAVAFAEETERLALDLNASTEDTATVVSLDCHAKHLSEGLGFLADAILRPRFDSDELDRVREIRIGEISQSLDDPSTVANWAADRLFFGETHPLGQPILGRKESVGSMGVEDLRGSWQKRYGPERATFVVAGAVDKQALSEELEQRFGEWNNSTSPATPVPAPRTVEGGPERFIVDNPGSAQSVIVVLQPGFDADDPQLAEAEVGTTVLGGTFTSRLMGLLREEKGYTYGVRTRLIAGLGFGTVLTKTPVQSEVTGAALKDLLGELVAIRDGVDEAEIEKAVGARRTELVDSMRTRSSIASTYASIVEEGHGPEHIATHMTKVAQATPASVKAAMERLSLERSVIVVVGDDKAIRPQLDRDVPGDWRVVEK